MRRRERDRALLAAEAARDETINEARRIRRETVKKAMDDCNKTENEARAVYDIEVESIS
jgi:hypothetical protein